MSLYVAVDELERDLGLRARLELTAKAGGQRMYIPLPNHVSGSPLHHSVGLEIATWLSGRYGGHKVEFPSKGSRVRESQALALRAAVIEAGLTDPTRSANRIASEFGVTERRVRQVRQELRKDWGGPSPLPLFDRLQAEALPPERGRKDAP